MAKQYGGWYDDPSSGYNRRWWGTDASGKDVWGEYGVQIGQPAQPIATAAPSSQPQQSFNANDYVNSLIQTLTGQVVPQAIEFDTEAARAAAEQEWNPYYDEILNEYLGDLERLSGLRQERTGGAFADRGLYMSGQREEAQQLQLGEEQRQRERRERDLARAREESITGQVETQREEKFYGW